MKFTIVLIIALLILVLVPLQALAISNPDNTPTVVDVWAWRNVLETGDILLIVYENTPYATTPTDYTYSEAFIWRFMDGDDELGQAVGFDYDEEGFGYNVIGFYLDSSDAPLWAGDYDLRLSGNPAAFADPPMYTYNIPASSYSTLADQDEVQANIATQVLWIANDLRSKWGLTSTTTLIEETETAQVLSLNGQTFFRGAIYGLQGMAPTAFSITIRNYDVTARTWTGAYSTNISSQYSGNYIEDAFDAGETLFDVDYNLLGIIITASICFFIIGLTWYVAGGNLWKGIVESVPSLVIMGRLAFFPFGELSLIAALCCLYTNAKLWRII